MSKMQAKRVYEKLAENGGKSVSAAMRAVGYSPEYARQPQKFLRTKTAQELEQEYLPDELIATKHRELLEAGEIQHYVFPKGGGARVKAKGKTRASRESGLTNAEIKTIVESVPGCRLIYVKRDYMGAWAFFEAPDHRSRERAIDMAYKRKGTYAPEQINITRRKYQGLSNAELVAKKKKLKDFLLKK